MYKLGLSQRARKDIDDLPDNMWPRVRSAINDLRNNPRPTGCKKLKGQPKTYRIRVGNYRALYDVDDTARTVVMLRVQHRRDAYRDL
ncbi:MAG: type II toxin-antitoxin system RelE/ParE family toxin [Dehalococcoidia bacterium]|nr:type II toxin-antitoxin system RelE/ParE family toxin [Dehalococcoidia bacterium]